MHRTFSSAASAAFTQWRPATVALLALTAALIAPQSFAQISASATSATLANQAAAPALRPDPAFAKLPRYTGTLGNRPIVLRLGAKTDEPSGVHGEYQFVDSGATILIAGDRDGDTLEVEESDDGTQITGNWVGKFAADGSLAGTRMNVDDSDPQPFALRPATGQQTVQAVSPPPASSAGPSSNVRAVGGVSNLSTGE
ncbi:hypothetical protein QS306_07565 [Paraburkholderia bonniea]|uniref:hypothetical protein n=1 Tax=Paraburkholderia bonniea TaxID=2152891 RepID=UPI002573814F|nr:hypothetical protein [Paraburkholderia bonniea]WJF89008.1 hypothetical protein QS306_07565 [Paraburkholderia bonniea]WJF92324.1 hypothetical protein QS308_07575 [Paraburkholderia bonniea]